MLFENKANMSEAFKSHPAPLDPSESLSEPYECSCNANLVPFLQVIACSTQKD